MPKTAVSAGSGVAVRMSGFRPLISRSDLGVKDYPCLLRPRLSQIRTYARRPDRKIFHSGPQNLGVPILLKSTYNETLHKPDWIGATHGELRASDCLWSRTVILGPDIAKIRFSHQIGLRRLVLRCLRSQGVPDGRCGSTGRFGASLAIDLQHLCRGPSCEPHNLVVREAPCDQK